MYVTHENHFQFGWGSSLYNFEDKHGDYWVKFGRAKYIPTSFRDECVRAARLIGENAKQPILVCFSGGIDSEIVVRSFQEAKVPFEVLIMKLKYRNNDHINSHDTEYAFNYVNQNSIPYRTITVDLDDFYRNKLIEEVKKYKAGKYIGILIHNEMIKQLKGFHCVLGGGDINLERHRYNGRPNRPGMYLEEEIISIALIESAHQNKCGISSRFFMHTPELMLSWLLDPDIQHWIKYEVAFASKFTNINYFGIKPFVMFRHWPDMVVRPKFTGLEKIYELHRNGEDPEVAELIRHAEEIYETEIIIDYTTLLENLLPL